MAGTHSTLGLATPFLSTFFCHSGLNRGMVSWSGTRRQARVEKFVHVRTRSGLQAVRNLTAISLPPASFSGLLLFFGPSFVSSDETRKTVQHTSIPVPVLQLALQRVDLGLQFADVFHELAVLHRGGEGYIALCKGQAVFHCLPPCVCDEPES